MRHIKHFVGDLMAEIRCPAHNAEAYKDSVSRNHNLRRELFTEDLVPIRTQQSEKHEEEDCCKEYNQAHGVAQMNMHPHHSVEWDNAVQEGF